MAYKTESWGGCGRHLSLGTSSKVAIDGPFEAVLGKTRRTEFSRGKGKPEAQSSPPGAPSLLGIDSQVVIELSVALGAGAAVTTGDEPPRLPLQGCHLLGDAGPDAVDIEANVHAIRHRLLVAVFHHEVVVEEADGLGCRRGGQPDQERVEVVQHLAPKVVDGSVALIDDGEIKGLDGDALAVDDGLRLLDQAGRQLEL